MFFDILNETQWVNNFFTVSKFRLNTGVLGLNSVKDYTMTPMKFYKRNCFGSEDWNSLNHFELVYRLNQGEIVKCKIIIKQSIEVHEGTDWKSHFPPIRSFQP